VELHDGLMSELAATKYLLEGRIQFLENGKTINAGDLRRVADILGGTMKEARRLMNNLHPSMLDELGLIATIGWLGLEYQNSYPHISVQKEMTVSEEEIAEGVKVVIYRVLQEALHNFARHGKGDRVEISLSKADGILTLVIRDNGQGFDVGAVKMGFGLESMRERVEISGGEFQLESAIGQGTTIRATWASLQSSSAAFARREPTR
jgi:signal transduction histidine kinase